MVVRVVSLPDRAQFPGDGPRGVADTGDQLTARLTSG
jgi:hypothetical protein